MRPLLSERITLRVSEEELLSYTRAAANLGLKPSEYLRLRLNSVEEQYVADQIAQLRLTLLDNLGSSEKQASILPILLETLLLLRRICQPGDLRTVQAELQRLGHTPWAAPH